MISKNIIILLVIFIVIGIIVYFYYNYNNSSDLRTESQSKLQTYKSNKSNKSNKLYKSNKSNKLQNKKKVRFNNKVEYNVYDQSPVSICSTDNNLSPKSKLNINEFFQNSDLNSDSDLNNPTKQKMGMEMEIELDSDKYSTEIDLNSESDILHDDSNIRASNLEDNDPEATWDASFGLPLTSKEEKKDYFNKMQKNFQQYGDALDDFGKYQMDRSTVIQTETTINPFKPDHRSYRL